MNFRRYYYPGQIVFITQVVKNRIPVFWDEEKMELLRRTLSTVQDLHPFKMIAYVFLPDHLHLLINPSDDTNFSKIMHSLKRNFTIEYKKVMNVSTPYQFWQDRFWDHVIRDEKDLENHIHYIHINPVKHGWVSDPFAWNNSSIKTWQNRGLYQDTLYWDEPNGSSWGE